MIRVRVASFLCWFVAQTSRTCDDSVVVPQPMFYHGRAFDRCHPYCLFVFSPPRPPVTCGKAFFASFAPPPIILLLRTYLDPIIVQNLIDLENGARLELLLLSTDVLWRTRCHDWRHKFPQISNWHRSPGSTDISQFLFFSKQKTSNKEHKTATRDKK